MKEPKALKEIHEIMEMIYKEEKGLSIEKRLANIKKESKEFLLRNGLGLRKAKAKSKYTLDEVRKLTSSSKTNWANDIIEERQE